MQELEPNCALARSEDIYLMRLRAVALAAVVAVGLCLSACGGGGGGGKTSSSDDASLAALTVVAGALSPAFDPDVMTYTLEAGLLLASTTVTPTAGDSGATITVEGLPAASGEASDAVELFVGVNPVMVVVTAADGTTQQTYTVVIVRAAVATQAPYLKASNAEQDDTFGGAVSVSGDTLVVGARSEDSSAQGGEADNSADGAGAAYVFVRTGATWTQQAYLKASNAEASDLFGVAVSVAGNTLVVGAAREGSSAGGGEADNSVPGAGAAYVFVRTGTTWTQQAYLKASNADGFDNFGGSVSVSGDTLVVGAISERSLAGGNQADNSGIFVGAAYVFVRTGTTWTQQAYLKASNPGEFDGFGGSVSASGDTVAVGASDEGSSAGASGAVYVFVRTGTTWTQQAMLKASNPGLGDGLGGSVSLSGETLVAGAAGERSSAGGGEADNSLPGAGAAYVFVRTGTTWTQQAYLKASNAGENDRFGVAISVSGDTLVVGSVQEDSSGGAGEADNSAVQAGAAYVFVRTGTTWTQQAFLKASNAEAGDRFGDAVSVSEGTVVVGARDEDSRAGFGEGDSFAGASGAAYIYE